MPLNYGIDFIRKLNQNCYVFVITNQSGIGRGFYSEKNVESLHNWMNIQLRKKGAHIDEFFYAPYYKFAKNGHYHQMRYNAGIYSLNLHKNHTCILEPLE
jgi:D-glycero-D-manno-heptose 1,7-bisphosphate phosphatase